MPAADADAAAAADGRPITHLAWFFTTAGSPLSFLTDKKKLWPSKMLMKICQSTVHKKTEVH